MFKKAKKRSLRERHVSSSSEDDKNEEDTETVEARLEEAKELQKLRKRAHGIDIETLAKGDIKKEKKKEESDPFKKSSGGMVNLAEVKKGVEETDDAYDTGIGTAFSAETNKRDEDAEMQKYIEAELAKRRGAAEEEDEKKNVYMTPEEAALMSVPEHLRKSTNKRSEEMLSNQMLSGIPEIDLGLEAKIKNIEATEAAKMRLLAEQRRKKDGPSHFVPTNVAVNFVQHNRFSIKEPTGPKKKVQRPEPKPVLVVGGIREEEDQEAINELRRKQGQAASDDYMFNKFKNQYNFRR